MRARTRSVDVVVSISRPLVLVLVALLSPTSSARAQPALHAAASHDDRDGPIALWTRDALLVSRDDGASFTTLAMPVTEPRAVVVERGGALVVLGGTRGGEETLVRRVRADTTIEPIAAPSWISALGSAAGVLVGLLPYEGAVAIARNGGPFVVHPLPSLFDRATCRAELGGAEADPAALDECTTQRGLSTDASLALDRDGTAHVLDVEVNTCTSRDVLDWARTLTIAPDGTSTSARLALAPTDTVYPTRWVIGAAGWLYALGSDGHLAARGVGRMRALGGPVDTAIVGGARPYVAGNGALTVTQVGPHLVRVAGTHAEALTDARGDAWLVDVDARGRLLALSETALHRWSRRDGWQVLWRAAP